MRPGLGLAAAAKHTLQLRDVGSDPRQYLRRVDSQLGGRQPHARREALEQPGVNALGIVSA